MEADKATPMGDPSQGEKRESASQLSGSKRLSKQYYSKDKRLVLEVPKANLEENLKS